MATQEELEAELDEIEAKLKEARAKGPGANFGPVKMNWIAYMKELREQKKDVLSELNSIPYEKTSVVDFPEE